jgi:hypothetical protein
MGCAVLVAAGVWAADEADLHSMLRYGAPLHGGARPPIAGKRS